MKKMTRIQKIILLLMTLTVLCLCVSIIALTPSSPPITPDTKGPSQVSPPAPPAPTPLQYRAAGAIAHCRQFIRDRLISPSSANFSREKSYKVNGEPLNHHAVVGIVESQNRLGVLLRSEYRCDTHYLPDDPGVWVLDYLDIQD
jgi:hypothetical protein